MINTRGAAELAQNTWMKDYRALSEMGQCLSLSERRSAPALITMLCSLLLLLAGSGNMSSAPWPLPSDMHRMATSARSEGQFPARSTCSACKSVYRGCTESEKVYFPTHKEPWERVCNNTGEKITVLLYNQEEVQMSHPVGLSGVHLHSAHSSSNTALIKWLDEWRMGGSLTEPGKPFLCTCNPGRSRWRERRVRTRQKDTSNDSSLTARLMTQHTKARSCAAFW